MCSFVSVRFAWDPCLPFQVGIILGFADFFEVFLKVYCCLGKFASAGDGMLIFLGV